MQLLCELVDDFLDTYREFLQAAWRAYRPGAIAEVAFDLAQDRRYRIAREGVARLRVIPVDRFDESQRGDLDEVIKRFARSSVAQR